MFRFTDQWIDDSREKKELMSPDAGCLIIYESTVRDLNLGQKVVSLDLKGDPKACQVVAEKILYEVKKVFNILSVRFVHRVGHLDVGDTVAWVGISATHRDAAYQASQYIIDQMKLLMPIRKRERYADGTNSAWLTYQEWAKRRKT